LQELFNRNNKSPYLLPEMPTRFRNSKPLPVGVLNSFLLKVAIVAGVEPFAPHDLRRSAKSLLARNGVEEFISEDAGHQIGGVAGVYNRNVYF